MVDSSQQAASALADKETTKLVIRTLSGIAFLTVGTLCAMGIVGMLRPTAKLDPTLLTALLGIATASIGAVSAMLSKVRSDPTGLHMNPAPPGLAQELAKGGVQDVNVVDQKGSVETKDGKPGEES